MRIRTLRPCSVHIILDTVCADTKTISDRKTLDNNDLNQIGHLMNFTQRIISVMERARLRSADL